MEEEIKVFYKMFTDSPLQRSCSVENTQLLFWTLYLLPLDSTHYLTLLFKAKQHLAGCHPARDFGRVSLWLSLWGSIPLLPQPTVVSPNHGQL